MPAPKPRGSRNLWVDAVVVVGIAVSLGLIVASMLLNYRMGFRSADNATDGVIYGGAASLGDALKAMAPFAAYWGRKQKDRMAVAAANLLFMALTAYSFTAALGFAAQHRAVREGANKVAIETYADNRRERARLEAERDRIGAGRSSRELAAAIEAALKQPLEFDKRTVAEVSKDCTQVKPGTRQACAAIAELMREKATAEERERLDKALAAMTRNPEKIVTSADAQVDALETLPKMLGVNNAGNAIRLALALLMATLVELGSGLGLYVVTTPWRATNKPEGEGALPQDRKAKNALPPPRFGSVELFALERLEPKQGAELAFPEIYSDYTIWCRWRGDTAARADAFMREFAELVKKTGIPADRRNNIEVFRDLGFVGGV